MQTTQPLAEELGPILDRQQAISHLEQALPALADISDYMAYLARTMIDELKVRDSRPAITRGTKCTCGRDYSACDYPNC